jgi:hypothetical protein
MGTVLPLITQPTAVAYLDNVGSGNETAVIDGLPTPLTGIARA